jgi:hypothetical protein
MYLEREVYGLLIGGFAAITLIDVFILARLYLKTRNKHVFWFGGQAAFLAAAFYYFYKAIAYLPNQGNAMYSENQSITIALAGIAWAVSMGFVLLGVFMLVRKKAA